MFDNDSDIEDYGNADDNNNIHEGNEMIRIVRRLIFIVE